MAALRRRSVRARTRPAPRAAAHARILRATPETLASLADKAQPGDILNLAPGNYGPFAVKRDGAPGKPIVFRSRNGEAVFPRFFMNNRKYVHLEGATVNGAVDLLGGENLVVRHCIDQLAFWRHCRPAAGGQELLYCRQRGDGSDALGPQPYGRGGAPGYETCKGEGIMLTGPGNVICHNRVKGYRDCISFMEDQSAGEQVCIDVYNNDIYVGLDDAIEADFAMGNCRILRNRITNCFMGLSSQPGLGGPTYFIRNVMYNITNSPFKIARRSVGDVILHNTMREGRGRAGGAAPRLVARAAPQQPMHRG